MKIIRTSQFETDKPDELIDVRHTRSLENMTPGANPDPESHPANVLKNREWYQALSDALEDLIYAASAIAEDIADGQTVHVISPQKAIDLTAAIDAAREAMEKTQRPPWK